ncbi:MAG: YlxR family protein [Defluviitaleaceae bacterium]|nr:YlxR family protein [Defluviitaleaceae bacterium]
MKEKSQVIRISLGKDGDMNVDPTGKMHGRAAYICQNSSCLESAKKIRGLERSFKRSVPPEIYEEIAKQMEMFL